jgi:methylglutaconyl-CoA hydratase
MIAHTSMSQPLVKTKLHEHAGTIILNRPDKRNALSRDLLRELAQAFDDLHQERRVRAVVLTGAGSSFCAGMDLGEMLQTSKEPDPHPRWHDDAVQYRDLLEKMLRFPKPIIAAVNGPAMAGGAGLVLASDIVLGAAEARFGLPEPKRGLVAGVIAPLLVFRIGAGQAASLMLTARSIDGTEAARLGLFHEIVATEKLWARSVEVAAECAESAAEALALSKRMLNETIGEHLVTLLAAGAAVSATARTTEAAAEGVAAFLEKRAPKWP